MLDAFGHLLCFKLCWHNRPVPKMTTHGVQCVAIGFFYSDADVTCSQLGYDVAISSAW